MKNDLTLTIGVGVPAVKLTAELQRIEAWIQAEYDELEKLLKRRKDRLSNGIRESITIANRVTKHGQELALLWREKDTLKGLLGDKWAISNQEDRAPENRFAISMEMNK